MDMKSYLLHKIPSQMDHAADILIIFVIKEAFKFIISLSIESISSSKNIESDK